ncbi:hypothetical protein EW026_g6506 [Hermanssonia centrifuga]|uniref:Uncharacterized protein n=1 Tax=Hermanssonia centrifuga TaxID=98765 RepID=A0A4S4KF56_9APHY|nr:hypothetical protein EW026_g6506 [Hermanssonia centrifuga]
MMFKSALLVASLYMSAVSGTAVVQRSGLVLRDLLVIRQSNTPAIPSSAAGCSSQCTAVSQTLENAASSDDSSAEATICTDTYFSQLAQCYDCAAPYVQQAGTDPNYVSETQTDINQLAEACNEEGYKVTAPTIKASSDALSSYSLSGMLLMGVVGGTVAALGF